MKKDIEIREVRIGKQEERVIFSFKNGELISALDEKEVMKRLKNERIEEIKANNFSEVSRDSFGISNFPQEKLKQFEHDYQTFLKNYTFSSTYPVEVY